MGTLNGSMILIWKPDYKYNSIFLSTLTRECIPWKREYAFDEAKKHFNYRVCVYAFRFPFERTDYQIVHVYKRNYEDTEMNWTLYHQKKLDWSKPKKFKTAAANQLNKFFEVDVPEKAKGDFHALINYNEGVGFVSQTMVGVGAFVMVWQLKSHDEDIIWWEKKITVTGIGLMFNPTMVIGEDMLSVTETHCRYGCSNDAHKTNVIISKHEYEKDNPEHLICRCWKDNVVVKAATLHCDGLYLPNIIDHFEIN
ncbi:hypothetical protein PIB30_023735 [Stylosanthes scabra]|uniref:F-box associated domain-containing protein n=1 Tax=Stylosanthes scabra TaxID=79078 RepID=A0ABU6V7W0_9FABA|nr:hypothetical protein [Stylosanthes scabra]